MSARVLSALWVLMDQDTRSSVSPDKSGIIVPGTLRGTELALPGGLVPRAMEHSCQRDVCFTDLDRNGYMNNTRYMDWIDDISPQRLPPGASRERICRALPQRSAGGTAP